jgi:predicted YcjX-like family ATPase
MTAIKYVFAKDNAGLTKMIDSAITSANTMKTKVQIAAVAIIKHTHDHGDYSGFKTLVDGLGNGVNTKALVEYITVMTGLVVDEENKTFSGKVDKKFIMSKFDDAKAIMWHSFKPQKPFAGFDLNAEIAKLIKKCEKMGNLDGEDKELVTVDVAQLQALVKVVKA